MASENRGEYQDGGYDDDDVGQHMFVCFPSHVKALLVTSPDFWLENAEFV